MEKCFLWSVNFNVRCILNVFKVQTVSYIFLIMLVGKLGKKYWRKNAECNKT